MTSLFTFRSDLTLSLLAEDEEQARALLDQSGGYVRARTIELVSIEDVQNPKDPSLASVSNLIAAKGGHNHPAGRKKPLLKNCPECPVILYATTQEILDEGVAAHKLRAHSPSGTGEPSIFEESKE